MIIPLPLRLLRRKRAARHLPLRRSRPRYSLRVTPLEARMLLTGGPDDFPDDLDHAHVIGLAADGSGTQAGIIETGSDVDAFQFVAPVTGQMSLQAGATQGSSPSLSLFEG